MTTFFDIADSYKQNHHKMYPQDIKKTFSVLYVRNPRMDLSLLDNKVCVFGIEYAIQELNRLFKKFYEADFLVVKDNVERPANVRKKLKIDYTKIYPKHFIDDMALLYYKISQDINPKDIHLNDLDIRNYVKIKYVPDGAFVGVNEVVLSIESKYKEFNWLPNYLETYFNNMIWKPTFIATQSALLKAIEMLYTPRKPQFESGDYNKGTFAFHDFSCRGMSGIDDAKNSNVAHFIFHNGSDNILASRELLERYTVDSDDLYPSTIPASEHSVMCLYGKENELEAVKSIMQKFPDTMCSIVADTWDFFGLLERLHNDVEFNEMLAQRQYPIVLRPDSGDPVKILCGDDSSEDPLEKKGAIRIVNEYFGFDKVRLIYGDSINIKRATEIYKWCYANGFNPLEFLCLGIGSYTYNYATRDDVGFVSKMIYCEKDNGESVNLKKEPKTAKWKSSLTGKVEPREYNPALYNPVNFGAIRNFAYEQLCDILNSFITKQIIRESHNVMMEKFVKSNKG